MPTLRLVSWVDVIVTMTASTSTGTTGSKVLPTRLTTDSEDDSSSIISLLDGPKQPKLADIRSEKVKSKGSSIVFKCCVLSIGHFENNWDICINSIIWSIRK